MGGTKAKEKCHLRPAEVCFSALPVAVSGK
jgi:hypothetical protein